MKVLVVGEGPGDIGRRDVWCPRTKDYINLEGWLQPVIRLVRPDDTITFIAETRKGLKLQPREISQLRPLPSGHGAKALFAKRMAIVASYDVVVYLVDADSSDVSRWREIISEVQAGFDALEGEVACIACVPMSMSESWLLADARAWECCSGAPQKLPANPESLWGGRDDPDGQHPHRVFAYVCRQAGVDDNSVTRNNLAVATDLQRLAARCPTSFPPFADALRAA